ncbi:MAG: arginine--tRNA ligase [Candidatus Paceibacterota bacterium]|jgi:arginyl-tRNA synthetase
MTIQGKIKLAIKDALGALGLPTGDFLLEHPADLNLGDYASNVAMVFGKKHNRLPKDLASDIIKQLYLNNYDWLEKAEVAGPGFINIFLTKKFLTETVVDLQTGELGLVDFGTGQKAIVEYSSPNIAKPFSIGHLRSTIIGAAIANLLEVSGYKIIRHNYLGDWGTQFGKMIVAIKKWGDLSAIEKSAEPVKELVALYVRFHEEAEKDKDLDDEARSWFTKLEQGNEEAVEIWQKCIALSKVDFTKIYQRLGVEFDLDRGESFLEGKTGPVLVEIKKSGFVHESEGATLFFFPEDSLPPMMLAKKDGSSLYALRDLASDFGRQSEFAPDLIINEAGSEQKLHFEQVIEAERLLGWFRPGQRVHIGHGLYRFAEGKMSTRKGNVIWLEEVLDEVVKRASEFNPDSAEAVGIGALKYNDLKRDSKLDITFDWDDVLNLKGNSGPYLQYTVARAKAILDKSDKNPAIGNSLVGTDLELSRWLYRFPEVVERSAREYAPHQLCTYLYELASTFNAFYAQEKIVGGEGEESKLALVSATANILAKGLDLLGIAVPEKM